MNEFCKHNIKKGYNSMTQAHMEIIAYIVHNKENNITFKSLNNFFWK